MANVFPTLGAADDHHARGMFIADKHDVRDHVLQLARATPKLGPIIDTLFLEAFFATQNPPQMDVEAIRQHLVARSFDWTPNLASDLHDLVRDAGANGIEVQGIDLLMPATFEPKLLKGFRKIRWRASPDLNGAWARTVNDHMQSKAEGSRRFAIFAGMVHGGYLKNHGLPNLICFQWNGQKHAEI